MRPPESRDDEIAEKVFRKLSRLMDEIAYPFGTVMFSFHLRRVLKEDPWRVYIRDPKRFWEG